MLVKIEMLVDAGRNIPEEIRKAVQGALSEMEGAKVLEVDACLPETAAKKNIERPGADCKYAEVEKTEWRFG